MSKLYTRNKPLAGSRETSGVAVFDTVIATSIQLENVTIGGGVDEFENINLNNVNITDSIINSSSIGIERPGVAYFLQLNTIDDVNFAGDDITKYVSWDSANALFTVSGELSVLNCSRLGNLKICQNTISSENLGGSIILQPNSRGQTRIDGGTDFSVDVSNNISMVTQNGNISTNSTGYTDIKAGKHINLSPMEDINLDLDDNRHLNFGTVGQTIYPTTAGNLIISASSSGNIITENLQVLSGSIDSTPIGLTSPRTGIFTNLQSTGDTTLGNLKLGSNINYSFERLTLDSTTIDLSPSENATVTMINVSETDIETTGTMPNTNIEDGTYKIIMCSKISKNSTYTLHFGSGNLITPNPRDTDYQPEKILFKRQSQSAHFIYDSENSAWVLLSSGGYVI